MAQRLLSRNCEALRPIYSRRQIFRFSIFDFRVETHRTGVHGWRRRCLMLTLAHIDKRRLYSQ